MLRNSPSQFGLLSKLFHWAVAILIIGLFALGFWMVDLSYYSDWYQTAPFYHESFGILLALIFIVSIVWRTIEISPTNIASHKHWEMVASKQAKLLMTFLIFNILISGFLISTADFRGVNVFNLFEIPPLFEAFENQEDITGQIHKWCAYLLIGIVVVHMVAALKHHFYDKDETLKRIL
ncbi:MAG: cytochrome b [Kangiellaceae bacterium]|nr:cytochrome b [Kangiellaceae bacterium]MCW8999079.1 cytochrome b [Kangiellaceae bacterium]MCW9017627.1 cytochrome b [Kangiellaceae bacterium]